MLNIRLMDQAHSLGPLLDKLASVRVLCIGDVMLDRFIYGAVDRVSPEAPIPVLRNGVLILVGLVRYAFASSE